MVRNLKERGGPGKLRSYWEDEIHVVVRRKDNSPVYEVRPENGYQKLRTLHRNLLLACDSLPFQPVKMKPEKQSKRTKETPLPQQKPSSSDSDDDWRPVEVEKEPESSKVSNKTTGESSSTLNPDAEVFEPVGLAEAESDIESEVADQDALVPIGLTEEESDKESDADDQDALGTGSEEASTDNTSDVSTSGSSDRSTRPKRNRRPPNTLTYDTLGKPSLRPQLSQLSTSILVLPVGSSNCSKYWW